MYSTALSINKRLGWKGLPVKNTLAYNEHLQITDEKCFIACSLMFVGKAKSLPIEHPKGVLLMDSPALSKNIRLG
jgi:hypothetical protein